MDQELGALFDFRDFGLNLLLLELQSRSLLSRLGIGELVAEALLHQMVLLLGGFCGREPKVILYLQEAGSRGSTQVLKRLDGAGFGSSVERCVAHVVFLEELVDEDVSVKQLLQRVQGIVFRTHVEHRLVLVVPQLEVLFSAREVLLEHGNIVVLERVEDGQVSVEVADVWPGSDLVHDRELLVDAHDVLDCLSLEVLHSTRLEKLVVAGEPVEDVFVAVASTFEQGVLPEVVLLQKSFVLELCENLEHFFILALHGHEEGALSFEIGLHAEAGTLEIVLRLVLKGHFGAFNAAGEQTLFAFVRSERKKQFHEIKLACPDSYVERGVTSERISTVEDIQS